MRLSSAKFSLRVLFILCLSLYLTLAAFPSSSFAQDCEPSSSSEDIWGSEGPGLTSDPNCLADPVVARGLLSDTVSMVLNLVLIGGAFAAFAMFIYGAFRYMSARDDPAKTKKARDSMQYAVVGLIIMSLVYVFILIYNGLFPSA